MKIINQSKNIVLAENANIANTPIKRMQGLLGRDSLGKGEALIIEPSNAVHTFFMRFAIDVLFVDKNNKIIKVISSLKPFRCTPIFWGSRLLIELPGGAIQSSSIQEGDNIRIE